MHSRTHHAEAKQRAPWESAAPVTAGTPAKGIRPFPARRGDPQLALSTTVPAATVRSIPLAELVPIADN